MGINLSLLLIGEAEFLRLVPDGTGCGSSYVGLLVPKRLSPEGTESFDPVPAKKAKVAVQDRGGV